MKASVLIGLLADGKKPMVRLTDNLWDESFGAKGMLARVTASVPEPDGTVSIAFDYNEHREHNVALDEPSWYLKGDAKGTAIEAGHFDDPNNLCEDVIFEPDADLAVELVETETPLAEYIASGTTQSYVEWLEAKLEELVPNCMKDWKKGLD